MKTTNDETLYTATFTLTQTGNGPVHSKLEFSPLTGEETPTDVAPAPFQIMSQLVAHFLYITGMIDEEGELLDPDTFLDKSTVSIN